MGVRLEQRFPGFDSAFTVRIHDTQFTGTAAGLNLPANTLSVEEVGDSNDLFSYIKTSMLTLTMFLDSTETESFFEDLKGFEEGRFFVELLNPVNGVEFFGKILIDRLQKSGGFKPTAIIRAIDGLADLKNVDYEHPGFALQSIGDILNNILVKNTVLDQYADSDEILWYKTNLKGANISFNQDNLFDVARLHNYFFTREGDVITPLSCYDALVEICKRFFMKIRYYRGVYLMQGMEQYHDAGIGSWYRMTKDNTINTNLLILPGSTNISNQINAGDRQTWQSGLKSIAYTVDAQKMNYSGSAQLWSIFYSLGTTSTKKYVGQILSGQDYVLKINNKITDVDVGSATKDTFNIRYRISAVNLTDSTESVINNVVKSYTLSDGEHVEKISIETETYDRNIYLEVLLEDFNGISVLTSKTIAYLSLNGKAAESIYFKSIVTTTNNENTKEIPLLSSQRYASEFSKIYFWDSQATSTREVTDTWRLKTTDNPATIEKLTLNRMLGVLRSNNEVFTCPIEINALTLVPGRAVVDNYGTYAVGGYKWFPQNGISDVDLILINPINETGVNHIDIEPSFLDATGTTSDFNTKTEGTIKNVTKPFHKVYTNVTGTEHIIPTTDYDIPNDATFKSMTDSIIVICNARYYYQVELQADLLRDTFFIDKPNNKIIFKDSLRGVPVQVIIRDYFIESTTN